MLLVVFLALAAGVGVSQRMAPAPPGPPPPVARRYTPPWYMANPDVQPDFILSADRRDRVRSLRQRLAWTTFVALSWPVSNRFNGVPNRANVIDGIPKKSGEGGGDGLPVGPTAWETFKDMSDIYLNPATKPTPFNAPDSIPPCVWAWPPRIPSPRAGR